LAASGKFRSRAPYGKARFAARRQGMAAQNKTKATEVDVAAFLSAVPDERRRAEGHALDALHRRVTGCEPQMWGPSIVGYGSYKYKYDSGREGVAARAAFSPRKPTLVLYLNGGYFDARQAEFDALLAKLGPHTTGKSCLYIKRLDKVDMVVLEALVRLSWEAMWEVYPD